MLQALIFDVDGTMADTENVHRVSFNRAFAAAGLDWHWDDSRYAQLLKVTGGKERIGHFIDTARPGRYAPEDRAALIASLHAAKTRIYARMIERGALQLRPGVAALMEAARNAGLKVAIATTTTPSNVTTLLRCTLGPDAAHMLDALATGDSVARKKPAPDVYLSALAQLDLPAEACLAIEDSHNGLRAALAAGLVTIVTPSRYTLNEDFTDAAQVMDSLAGDDGDSVLRALRVVHAVAARHRAASRAMETKLDGPALAQG